MYPLLSLMLHYLVSIPKRVSEVLKLQFVFQFDTLDCVSIPKRVSEVLKPTTNFQDQQCTINFVSIPKRVSEVLKH